MSTLLELPDNLFSNNLLKYLTVADLWHLGAVCRKFHGKDPEKNVVQKEFKARDDALNESKQYPPESPILEMMDHRRRVLAFERCSAFAEEMTREAKKHQTPGFSCNDRHCKYVDLYTQIHRLIKGFRIEKHFLFFARFTGKDKLLWQGFVRYYDPEDSSTNPMEDLLRKPDGELSEVAEALGAEVGAGWSEFERTSLKWAYVKRHFYTGNITNLAKEDMNSDLHVTLVSSIQSAVQPELPPELRLHYSSQGIESQFPPLSSLKDDSASFDVLCDQNVKHHKRGDDDCAAPLFIWKSKTCLHSFSFFFKSVGDDIDNFETDSDEDSFERDFREFQAYQRHHFGRYNNPYPYLGETNNGSDQESEASGDY